MSEWGVVGVIVVLVGLVGAIAKPLIDATRAITKLNTILDGLQESTRESGERNEKAHERIWEHNEEQDKQIEDHEKRLIIMEHGGKI